MDNKKVYATSEQRETLIEFIGKNKKLQLGKFSNDFTFIDAKKLWQEISSILNAMPGATKNWTSWRKTWHDLKTKAKNKKANIVKNFTITGGGSPPDQAITNEEDLVLQLINPTAIVGDERIEESAVCFDGTFSFVEENEIIQQDHGYSNVTNNKNIVQDQSASSSIKTRDEHPTIKEKLKKKIKLSKNERLSKTATATEDLAVQNKSFLELKRWYFEKKVDLKEAEIIEKRRIADALEKIAANF